MLGGIRAFTYLLVLESEWGVDPSEILLQPALVDACEGSFIPLGLGFLYLCEKDPFVFLE